MDHDTRLEHLELCGTLDKAKSKFAALSLSKSKCILLDIASLCLFNCLCLCLHVCACLPQRFWPNWPRQSAGHRWDHNLCHD